MQLTKPNSNNVNTETNDIAPTTTTSKTAPPSLNQPIPHPLFDDKIDTNSDDKIVTMKMKIFQQNR